jgi:hypothetical protein
VIARIVEATGYTTLILLCSETEDKRSRPERQPHWPA